MSKSKGNRGSSSLFDGVSYTIKRGNVFGRMGRGDSTEPVITMNVKYQKNWHKLGDFKLAEIRLLLGNGVDYGKIKEKADAPAMTAVTDSALGAANHVYRGVENIDKNTFGKWSKRYKSAFKWTHLFGN